MPYTIKTGYLNVKDENGRYIRNNTVAEQSTAAQIAEIEAASAAQQAAIVAKGNETRQSIPSDYTTLSNAVTAEVTAREAADNALNSTLLQKASNVDLQSEISRAETEEARIEALFTAPTQDAVDNWLDEHPEATTTVQDGSITPSKVSQELYSYIDNKSNTIILATWHDFFNSMDPYAGSGDKRTNRFYISIDGINFCEFNKSIYPLTIHSGTTNNTVGAPSLVYWNGYFMLISSSGKTDATHDATIGVSEDLINWQWYDYFLGIRFDNVTPQVFAPELCVLNGDLYVVQGIVISNTYVTDFTGTNVANSKSYIAKVNSFNTTDGFVFDNAQTLDFYEDDTPNIDAVITYDHTADVYYALVKNEYYRCVQSFKSYDLVTWEMLNDHVSWRFTEAPAVCYYGGTYHVYIDASRKHRGSQKWIYHATTDDFIVFSDFEPISASCKFTVQHGSVFTLTDKKAISKLQAINDYAIGGIGKSAKKETLIFYTSDIRVDIATGNTRTMNYVSVCPNTEYQITLNRDGIINYLDNTANLDFVRITIAPNVTSGTFTIINSGAGLNYTEINETIRINSTMREIILYKSTTDNVLHIMPDKLSTLYTGEIVAGDKFNLVSYICKKRNNVVQIQCRVTANENATSSDTIFFVPEGFQPDETVFVSGFMTSDFSNVPCVVPTNKKVALFGSRTMLSGQTAIFEFVYIKN